MDLLDRITSGLPQMTPKFARLSRFILKDPNHLALHTSAELARSAGVSESTVTRLAYFLGFSGYSELQQAAREVLKKNLVKLEREMPLEGENLFTRVFSLERNILDETLEKMDPGVFEKVVDLLYQSPEVWVVGIPPDNPPAAYFSNRLNLFRSGVHLLTKLDVDSFPALKDAQQGAVAVVFSFPRYPRMGRETTLFLKKKGATVIAITDSRLSPLAPHADYLLLSPVKLITVIEPYGGVMALLHSLLVGILFRDKEKALKKAMEYEDFVKAADYYIHKDIDLIDFA